MKELSIEERAQRYDKALQRTRRWYDSNTNKGYRAIFEDIFPELKESEDDKLREQVIYAINQLQVCECTKIKLLAWLEKQGEHEDKYPLCNSVKDKIKTYIANHFVTDDVVKTDVASIVKAMEEGVKFGKYEYERGKADAQKSTEWSEEDKKMLGKVLECIRFAESYYLLEGEPNGVSVRMWLLENINPQHRQEWSEEDKKMLNQIISIIKDADDDLIRPENISIYTNWLKSKMQPQLKWKPSELQIEALESATENCAYSEYQDCLKELIIELKKLTE